MQPRTAFAFVALLLPALAAGCGQSWGTVEGKMTLSGKPVKRALVTFLPEAGNAYPVTVVDGKYESSDIPVGPAKVTVMTAQLPPTVEEAKGGDLIAPVRKKQEPIPEIPDKYQDAGTSGLTLDIKRGKNTFDINLTP